MYYRTMELKELLKSNDTYPDTPEGRRQTAQEQQILDSGGGFDHQSPSAWQRLDETRRRMSANRTRFRLNPLFQTNRAQFDREYTFLQEQLPVLRQRITANGHEIDEYVRRRKPILHRAYTFLTGSLTSHNARENAYQALRDETRDMRYLRDKVEGQLAVYGDILAAPQLPPQAAPQLPPQAAPQLPPQAAPQLPPQAAPQLPPQAAPQAINEDPQPVEYHLEDPTAIRKMRTRRSRKLFRKSSRKSSRKYTSRH